jgi:hypothetical protein
MDYNTIVSQIQQVCLTCPGILSEPKNFRSGNGDLIRYADHFDKVKKSGITPHKFFGNCFRMSSALYYALGGREKGNTLCKTDRFPYFDGLETTHWAVKTSDGKILDPSWDQFTDFPNVKKSEIYPTLRSAHIGFPYFVRDGGKRYNQVVPSKEVLKIAIVMQKDYGTSYGLDWWLDERASQRGLADLHKAVYNNK